MERHVPVKAKFSVREAGNDLLVACQFWEVRHSSADGGNISSVVFPHGTGKNIFAAPCRTQISTSARGSTQTHTARGNDSGSCLSYYSDGEVVVVESESPFLSDAGERLPAIYRHRFEYHPWGYIRQRVTIECAKPIPNVYQVAIARPTVAARLNEFAYRPGPADSEDWRLSCCIQRWYKLKAGANVNDFRTVLISHMPLYFTFVQRGVEGFDWFLGENLDQWHSQFTKAPHTNLFMVQYAADADGYEVRTNPLWRHPPSHTLRGTYAFDFFMAFPFVQERVRPLRRSVAGLLEARPDRQGKRFPSPERIREFGRNGVDLTRLHDDGPTADGLFWRDGAYPPYPPKRMKEMDRRIADLHRNGVRVTPYFSLHEWHPDVPPFAAKAREWQRRVDDEGTMIHNVTTTGEFGAQMCLASGWLEFRKRTIDAPLSRHAFDGIYYDWCFPEPCLNKAHRPYRHWDVESFIDLLEWTRERVGPKGEMYLHMSQVPFITAGNMATYILDLEEYAPAKITPDMFPPYTHFTNACPHGVLIQEGKGDKSPMLFALCALLNHASVDDSRPEALATFKVTARIDFTRYKKFENHRTMAVRTSKRDVRSAIYWNEREALVLLANLSEKAQPFNWRVVPGRLGWGKDACKVIGASPRELAPLSFRYVRVKRAR